MKRIATLTVCAAMTAALVAPSSGNAAAPALALPAAPAVPAAVVAGGALFLAGTACYTILNDSCGQPLDSWANGVSINVRLAAAGTWGAATQKWRDLTASLPAIPVVYMSGNDPGEYNGPFPTPGSATPKVRPVPVTPSIPRVEPYPPYAEGLPDAPPLPEDIKYPTKPDPKPGDHIGDSGE